MMVDPCGSPVRPLRNLFEYVWSSGISLNLILFATVDASVRGSRKIAANCVKHCDVRNSENRQSIERTLHRVGNPRSVQVGVFTFARRLRPVRSALFGTPRFHMKCAWRRFLSRHFRILWPGEYSARHRKHQENKLRGVPLHRNPILDKLTR